MVEELLYKQLPCDECGNKYNFSALTSIRVCTSCYDDEEIRLKTIKRQNNKVKDMLDPYEKAWNKRWNKSND